jgi:hypothetical protein
MMSIKLLQTRSLDSRASHGHGLYDMIWYLGMESYREIVDVHRRIIFWELL